MKIDENFINSQCQIIFVYVCIFVRIGELTLIDDYSVGNALKDRFARDQIYVIFVISFLHYYLEIILNSFKFISIFRRMFQVCSWL